MSSKRRRSKRGASSSNNAPKDFGRRGSSGLKEAGVEAERIKMRQETNKRLPWRFYLKANEEAEVVILDESLDDAFFFYEHGMKDDQGKWGRNYQVCVKETDNCPMCAVAGDNQSGVGRSYYIMMLTIADLREFDTKKGEHVTYSRKLLAIKGSQIGEFAKILETAEKNNGTLRGTYLVLSRGDASTAASGMPTALDSGMVYDLWDEDTMFEELSHDAVLDDKNKVIIEEDGNMEAHDYEKLFAYPDVPALAKIYGGKAGANPAGSQADIAKEWDEEDEEDDEEEEDKPARRSRTRSKPAASKKKTSKRRTRAEPQEDPEDEPPARVKSGRKRKKVEEEAEEEVKTSRKRRTRSRRPAPTTDEGEEDEIPF